MQRAIAQPLAIVHEAMLQKSEQELRQSSSWGIPEHFNTLFQLNAADNHLATIPSLNDVFDETGKQVVYPGPAPDTLVRFRCMVQNTLNNEFYLGCYEAKNPQTQAIERRTGKYSDTVCGEADFDAKSSTMYQRMVLNCISIPGESAWVKAGAASPSAGAPTAPASTTPSKQRKRGLRDEDDEVEGEVALKKSTNPVKMDDTEEKDAQPTTNGGGAGGGSANAGKGARNQTIAGGGARKLQCLVKVYDEMEAMFKVGDIVEFVGVLSCPPTMETGDGDDNLEYHQWPSSLVRRLHVVTFRRMNLRSFLVCPSAFEHNQLYEAAVQEYRSKANEARSSLIKYLSHLLYGDIVAAEILLLVLLSCVNSRNGGQPIGKLSLNLVFPPATDDDAAAAAAVKNTVSHLTRCLCGLLPALTVIPINAPALSSTPLYPVKDHERDLLKWGALQAAPSTPLLLDETSMRPGQVNETGIKNLRALQRVLKDQVLEYDFQYHSMDFPVDHPVLLLSRGKSILAADIRLTLKPTEGAADPPAVSDAVVAEWRRYLGLARQMPFDLTDAASKLVEEWFVGVRARDPNTQEDVIHQVLTLGRLVCKSCLEKTLSTERWQHIVNLQGSVFSSQSQQQ